MIIKNINKLVLKFSSKIYITMIILLGISACYKSIGGNNQAKIKANAQSSQVSISTSLANNQRSLDPNFMCYNTNILFVNSWYDSDFQEAVQKLNPRILRLPGGTESQYWDLEKGSWIDNLDQIKHPYIAQAFKRIQANKGRYQVELKEIKAGLQATNTLPLFVLNILTSDLESQLAFLRKARDLGITVKYVQIGNEPWLNLTDNTEKFPTAQDYAETARQWTRAIKKEFPQAKVIVVGFDPAMVRRTQDSRMQNWNNSVFNTALKESDAVAIHIYRGAMLDSPITSKNDYPYFTSEDIPIILHVPFRAWEGIQQSPQFKDIPRNKEVWVTEYNFFSPMHGGRNRKPPRVIGSWAHGLYTMTMSLLFLEDDRISNICNHVLIGDSSFGAILADEKFFIDPSQKAKGTKFALTATGSALSLLGEATEGMTTATKINFSNSPTLTGKNNFKYSAVYGWQFSNKNNSTAIIMNLSNQNLNIDPSSILNENINYKQVYGNPRDLVTGSGILSEKKGKTSDTIILPAYSVTLLSND